MVFNATKTDHKYLYEAEHYLSNGVYEKALELFTKLYHMASYYEYNGGFQQGRYVYRLAQCHDALGNTEKAIAYYNQFYSLYENADSTYQEWVRNSVERLNVLGGVPEKELTTQESL